MRIWYRERVFHNTYNLHEDLVTERQSTSQHLQGRFGTQKDKVLHNTYMDKKTKYFTTFTWKIWYTERQTTSQH